MEYISGVVERITYENEENGFSWMKLFLPMATSFISAKAGRSTDFHRDSSGTRND